MGDPFSVGAGVVGVLGLTIQISRLIWEFGLDWRNAPEDIRNFMLEIQGLQLSLTDIQTRLISNPSFEDAFEGSASALLLHLKAGDSSRDSIKEAFKCTQQQLQDIVNDLESKEAVHKLGWERLKAPFTSKRAHNSIAQLQRQSGILQNLISIDTATLSARTYLEVKDFRNEHQKWHTAKGNQDVIEWLIKDSQLGFEKKHRDILSKLHPGTGEWLLESDEFKGWRNGQLDKAPNLWCPGIPGAGKTVLAAKVVNHLEQLFNETDVAILYLYCDYKDRHNQTDRNMLASLAKQSVLQQADISQKATAFYSQCHRGQRPLSLENYVALLKSSMNYFRRTFIVIDALDEYLTPDENEHGTHIPLLYHLYSLQQEMPRRCTMLITSRESDFIRNELHDNTRLEIRAKDEDIRAYVNSRIHNNFPFAQNVKTNTDLADEIAKKVVEKAQGMFLLPRLHLDQLAKQTSVRNLRIALDNLPSKLDDTYQHAMVRISQQDEGYCQLAFRALSWISKAKRPLTIKELQHAVSIELTDRNMNDESLVSTALITSVCAGLVSIDTESDTFRLVHFTVEEFFKNNSPKWFPDAEKLIAETCLVYMLLDVSDRRGPDNTEDSLEDLLLPNRNYLVYYAAGYWTYHAITALPRIQNMVNTFLGDEMKVASAFNELSNVGIRAETVPGLNLLARSGSEDVAQFWLCSGVDINARDSEGNTALIISAESQNHEISRLLLRHNADVNAKNKDGCTALIVYLLQGRYHGKVDFELLKLLINAGADVNEGNYYDSKALILAFNNFDQCALQLLLDAGADPNARGEDGQTCLHYAALRDHSNICKSIDLLLKAGADMEVRDKYGETPLMRSFRRANLHTAEFLLKKGAKIDFAPLKSCDREPPVLVTVQDAGIEGLLQSFVQSDHHFRAAEGSDKPLTVKVAETSPTKEIADLLLQDGVNMEIQSLSTRAARKASKTAFLNTAPSSVAVDIIDSLMRAGVRTDIAAEAEESTLIEAIKQRVKVPTAHRDWVRFSTWETYQNLIEKVAHNMMLTAAELRSQSEGTVQLLLLWGLSRELRQQIVASMEPSTGPESYWWAGYVEWQMSRSENELEDMYDPANEYEWEHDDAYETEYEWDYEVEYSSFDIRRYEKLWEGRRKAAVVLDKLRSWLGLGRHEVWLYDPSEDVR